MKKCKEDLQSFFLSTFFLENLLERPEGHSQDIANISWLLRTVSTQQTIAGSAKFCPKTIGPIFVPGD